MNTPEESTLSPLQPMSPDLSIEEKPKHTKTPKPLKALGILLIVFAALSIPVLALIIFSMVVLPNEYLDELDVTTFIIFGVLVAVLTVSSVFELIFGINLIRDKRRGARHMSEFLIVTTIASLLCEIMLAGLNPELLYYVIRLGLLIAVMIYLDPSLSEERVLQRKLRKMETRDRVEDGTLGRDESGKGYIELDFFNLFWIFVVGCVFGLVLEMVYHVVLWGITEDRAGMLYGPFSPISGFGALLMTVALNRFHDKSVILIFLVSAVIGGGFEFIVSWFMQFAFGVIAWDYSGTFLSIDGRTNGMYMAMWGILGCFWIKLLLPSMLKLINLIPWGWRYTITSVCAALMIANGFMTLAAMDCWYQREAGMEPESALEWFCAENYDNQFMENRFQSMTIDPNNATRTK